MTGRRQVGDITSCQHKAHTAFLCQLKVLTQEQPSCSGRTALRSRAPRTVPRPELEGRLLTPASTQHTALTLLANQFKFPLSNIKIDAKKCTFPTITL